MQALKEDIQANGLSSPICVFTGSKHSGNLIIRPGGSRLIVLNSLGWNYVPAIIGGEALPAGLEGVELFTRDEVHAYLSEGRFVNETNIFIISANTKPETMSYPAAKVRYFDKED